MSTVPIHHAVRLRRGPLAVVLLVFALGAIVLLMLTLDRGPTYSPIPSTAQKESAIVYMRHHPYPLPSGWHDGIVIRTGTGDDHAGRYAVVLMADSITVNVIAYGQAAQTVVVRGNYIRFAVSSVDSLLMGVNGRTTVALITAHAIRLGSLVAAMYRARLGLSRRASSCQCLLQ